MATRRGSQGDDGGPDDNGGRGGEHRGAGPVRTALIRGDTFGVKAVQYVVIDGMAMFEGDIVLGTVEEVERMTELLRAERAMGGTEAVMISGAQFQWPNCRVPFTIDPSLTNQQRVTDAIAHWESRTNVRFIARTTEADYVTFRPGSGCSAHVGRRGGQQFVNLGPGCSLGNTIHEIGHVVGLWHEQSREDRDTFVQIHWDKITPGMEHNFNQHITDGDDIGPYDFGSIMHYPLNAFTVDGSNTITPIGPVPPGTNIGQRASLSPGDIAAVNSRCPGVTIKERIKESIKDPIRETRKELVKEIRFDTRKEQIRDTIKEQIRDTIKEGIFDPGNTRAETLTLPGRPVIRTQPGVGGAVPFAMRTPQRDAGMGEGGQPDAGAGMAAELDEQLQQLADALQEVEAQRATLQAQYDETSGLLQQTLDEHDRSQG